MSNNRNVIWWIVGAALLFILQVSLVTNVALVGMLAGLATGGDAKPFDEEVVENELVRGKKVAVIDLYGLISYSVAGSVKNSMVDDIAAQLKQAREDDDVAAVVLNVDSPGGEITASDALYEEIQRCDREKPVVVYMSSLAASGAYYASMGARRIVANELCITGSIGVILQTINYEKLANWVGIQTLTFKSGKMKDMLNPARPITEEERAYVQGMIQESFEKFLGIVAKRRQLDAQQLRAGIADGRIVSGNVALKAGLVDAVGHFRDALDQARALAKLRKDAKVVRYVAPFHLGKLFRLFGKSPEARFNIQIYPDTLKLEAGKLYYLSSHLFNRF